MPDNINSTSMLPVGTILKDTYRIDSYLSSGGFGNTYVATNLTFNEKVAVKEFFLRGITQRDGESTVSVSNSDNRALFDEQLEKFRKEAQRIRRLRSPHVVRVHDLFDANGTAYYVMDYIDGESLAARLRRTQQPLSESNAMRYFGQVLDALEAIHAAGLCHMDLKPDNVMVDKEENAVLIDFGASKKIASDQLSSTVTGVSYTNGYAPPEQLESDTDNFGPWTDIYALGATLYKLLTNRKPPMPSAIYSDPTPDKSKSLSFPDCVSQQTRQLVRKLMTVVWHERPQSVADVHKIMGQAEQGTTDYQSQEINAIKKTVTGDDDSTIVRNKLGTGNDGDYTYPREGNRGDGYNSRKWIFALIGLLVLALIGGGVLVYNHNKKKEAVERAQFVSDSLANEKMLVQTRLDSIEKARVDSIEKARTDSIKKEEERQNEIKGMVDAYCKKVDEGIVDGYFLYDITQDGLPELWIKTGTFEADYQLCVYSYNNSRIKQLYHGGADHSSFHKGTNYILLWSAHMGYAGWYKLYFDGAFVKSKTIFKETLREDQNADDYTEPNEPYIQLHSSDDKSPILNLLKK